MHRSMYPSIYKRLRAIAWYWSEIATFPYPLHLTPPLGVFQICGGKIINKMRVLWLLLTQVMSLTIENKEEHTHKTWLLLLLLLLPAMGSSRHCLVSWQLEAVFSQGPKVLVPSLAAAASTTTIIINRQFLMRRNTEPPSPITSCLLYTSPSPRD